jgi:hypothetical protein
VRSNLLSIQLNIRQREQGNGKVRSIAEEATLLKSVGAWYEKITKEGTLLRVNKR